MYSNHNGPSSQHICSLERLYYDDTINTSHCLVKSFLKFTFCLKDRGSQDGEKGKGDEKEREDKDKDQKEEVEDKQEAEELVQVEEQEVVEEKEDFGECSILSCGLDINNYEVIHLWRYRCFIEGKEVQ